MRRVLAATALLSSVAFSQTLHDTIVEVLQTNPKMTERLKNYEASRQGVTIAKAGYLPKLDLALGVGQEDEERKATGPTASGASVDYDFDIRQASATLSYNLFEGFQTLGRVHEEESRTAAAAYGYIQSVNAMTLDVVNAYVEVLRHRELLANSRQNVTINEEIFTKVKKLYDSGLTTLSEVNKIESSLSLARSNAVVNETNLASAAYALQNLTGKNVESDSLVRPEFTAALPASEAKALDYALEHNPSMIIGRYNIEQAEGATKAVKSAYYPTVDLEVTKAYTEDVSVYQESDSLKVMAYLNYNLFNGRADHAAAQQNALKVLQQKANRESLHRDVTESLQLSWNSYVQLDRQLEHLNAYRAFSKKTLGLYSKEYDLGRRSLLDLLSAQSDYIGSQAQIIETEYDLMLAKYRVLDAMGIITTSLLETGDDYYRQVGADAPAAD